MIMGNLRLRESIYANNLHSCPLRVGFGLRKNGEYLGNEIMMILKVASIVHGISGCHVQCYSSPRYKQKLCQEVFIRFCHGSS